MNSTQAWIELSAFDKVQLTREFQLPAGAVIVQLGGYAGGWTTAMWCRYHPRVMHVFEPVPKFYRELQKNVAACQGVSTYPFGLLDEDIRAAMSDEEDGSSVFVASSRTVVARFCDVHRVFKELSLHHVDLVYMNIEGSEFRVLPRLQDQGWLPQLGQVLIQYHKYHPEATRARAEITQRLLATHELVWGYDWIWELWRLRASCGPTQYLNCHEFIPSYTPPAPAAEKAEAPYTPPAPAAEKAEAPS